MNTKQYQYILAVAELKNFGLAADKCFISQSTLSTMIGRFEDEIGIRIFDRSTKPISITQEGKELIAQIKLIGREIKVLDEKIQGIKGECIGELKIGVIPTVAPYLLPEFLNGFAKHYPKMKFDVSEMTTDQILELLESRELDVGILALPLENKNLVEIPLYNEAFVLYDCSNSTKNTYADLKTLDYSNFWLLAEGHCLHNQVYKLCDWPVQANERVNFNFKAGSIESLIRFVKLNKGISLLPYLATRGFPEKEAKKLSYFKEAVPVRTIGLLTHQHFVKKQVLEFMKEEIQAKILPLLKSSESEIVISPY